MLALPHRRSTAANRRSRLSTTTTSRTAFTTYSTVSLHETPNLLDGRDVRVEFAGVAANSETAFPNLIATAAFYVMKDRWLAAPGVVFPGLPTECDISSSLAHVLWSQPFPWEELGSVVVSASLTVSWLLAVPISEGERRLLLEQGYYVVEARFAEHDLPYLTCRDRRSSDLVRGTLANAGPANGLLMRVNW